MSQIKLRLTYFQFLLPTSLLSSVSNMTIIFEASSESQFIMEKYAVFTRDTNNGNIGSTIGCNTSRLECSNHYMRGKEQ